MSMNTQKKLAEAICTWGMGNIQQCIQSLSICMKSQKDFCRIQKPKDLFAPHYIALFLCSTFPNPQYLKGPLPFPTNVLIFGYI